MQSTNLTISVPEAGAMLGVSERKAYALAEEGVIPVIQVGRLKRVPAEAWRRKLEAMFAAAAGESGGQAA